MDVKADIIAWLLKQQDWFQELAERLIQQDDLTDNDLQQVIALLKTPPWTNKNDTPYFPRPGICRAGIWNTQVKSDRSCKGY